MNKSGSYRFFITLCAFLIAAGTAVPNGIHAKQLLSYCTIPVSEASAQNPENNCCPTDTEDAHNCGWGFICACEIGQAPLSAEHWMPANEVSVNTPEAPQIIISLPSEEKAETPSKIIDHSAPPIYLLNSIFLN